MTNYKTVFAGLDHYEKGGVEVINDDPKNYVFSNMFEVASQAKPWRKWPWRATRNTCSKQFEPKERRRGA